MILEAPLLLAGFVATTLSRSYVRPEQKFLPTVTVSLVESETVTRSYSSADRAVSTRTKAHIDTEPVGVSPATARLSRLARVDTTAVGVAAGEALTMLRSLPAGLPPPFVSVTNSGAVILVFQEDNEYAEIEFRGESSYSLYCRDLTLGSGEGFDDVAVADGTLCSESEAMLFSHFAPHLLDWPIRA